MFYHRITFGNCWLSARVVIGNSLAGVLSRCLHMLFGWEDSSILFLYLQVYSFIFFFLSRSNNLKCISDYCSCTADREIISNASTLSPSPRKDLVIRRRSKRLLRNSLSVYRDQQAVAAECQSQPGKSLNTLFIIVTVGIEHLLTSFLMEFHFVFWLAIDKYRALLYNGHLLELTTSCQFVCYFTKKSFSLLFRALHMSTKDASKTSRRAKNL